MPGHRVTTDLAVGALLPRAIMAVPLAALAALWPGQAGAQEVSPSVGACAALAGLSLADTTITVAQDVTTGSFTLPTGATLSGLPIFCRVAGSIRPTSDSNIQFEVWLPTATWNGRYGQSGNGGFAGSIPYSAVANALIRGFAAAGTDDGHTGSSLSGAWALGHPEKVVDYGYRAVHLTAVISQQVVAAYYGRSSNYSYFVGCSAGGREGMVEFQRYPDDFDGWVVGAPAYAQAALLSGFIWDEQAITETPASALPNAKLQVLTNAVIAQCDALDGVTDGVIDTPRLCHFDPGVLQCTGADAADCLTPQQVTAVRKIYAGPHNPRTGHRLYPGFEKGAEAVPADWPLWITNPDGTGATSYQRAFGVDAGRYLIFEDPAWDYRTYNFDSDFALAQRKLDPVASALNPNLRPIRAAGKRIIHYHGWADSALTPLGSIDYYDDVAAHMGGSHTAAGGLPQIADFYRLFMAPGMAHCSGGPGPNSFGQNFALNALDRDPQHDVVQAIVDWVENGVAPAKIVATKYTGDVVGPANVLRTRPLCPYPQVARWNGTGSSDDAANFTCHPGPDVGSAASGQ